MRRCHGLFIMIALVSGCSIFGAASLPPEQTLTGDNFVCVIMNDKKFKQDLVENLRVTLDVLGYEVVTVDRCMADYYDPADYAAVVYIAEYRFWHVPGDAKTFYNRSRDIGNVVFVITAASSELKVTKPFDAVTTASQSWKLHGVSLEVLDRLERILGTY